MVTTAGSKLERRVTEAAAQVLAKKKFVSPVLVFTRLGWLTDKRVADWEQGRVGHLTAAMDVPDERVRGALRHLADWARAQGLAAEQAEYAAATRDRRPLRFTPAGGEEAFRTHFVAADLTAAQRERLTRKQNAAPDLVVLRAEPGWRCADCGETDTYQFVEDKAPYCLECADLDHLVFLPAGDATLTRRAKKASGLAAVVQRFNARRKRFDRLGLLVEEAALVTAEESCLADADVRARRRDRDAVRREEQDVVFQGRLAQEIRRLFPGCPAERAEAIAGHAAVRGSGRVGRSAAGRALDEGATRRAVIASVRHLDTDYDAMLMAGVPRLVARERIRDGIDAVLARWATPAR
ncbi:hypothetical protein JOF53_006128 [Crossiella equi]|uniref:DUF2293 domain-containing protein n=1 Tax=Crossiella equi TaxID=130796 RepID=A0ABS5AL15_9PSEU|nr:DUF2293 domain-containing protein [Crossiella equi]MBP2477256.1 hypothetical protein [Crossiella equi]